MQMAVLGTGNVGRALAGRLAELGHAVTVGTRDPEATRARSDEGGGPWVGEHPTVGLATFAEAAAGADLVLNAGNGAAALQVLALAGAENLSGKILVDVTNPLDFSNGFPPSLLVKDTSSLAEEVQRAFPEARVVKTLNTVNASVMVHPEQLPEPTTVFVSGNDEDAKATVRSLLEELGHTDIIDLGDITTARGPEMLLPLWVRLYGTLGTPEFNIKVVR